MNRAGLATLALLAACSNTGSTGEVLVSAASSLTDAFVELEVAFEEANPGYEVTLNLGASSTLREQVLGGAPADVYASADFSNMEVLVLAGAAQGMAEIFARNSMQIAVPAGNPAGVSDLSDLARDGLLIGLCAEGVPCGDFSRAVLIKAGVVPVINTNEPNVRSLLTKLEAGELDAGIVYRSDVISAAGRVNSVDIPAEFNVEADYPIAVLAGASDAVAAQSFVAFVLSESGRRILNQHGFGLP